MADTLTIELVIDEKGAEVVFGKTEQRIKDFAENIENINPALFKGVTKDFDELFRKSNETRKELNNIAKIRLDNGNIGVFTKEIVRAQERSRQLGTDIRSIQKELSNPDRKSSISFLTEELKAAEKEAESLQRKLSTVQSVSPAGGGGVGSGGKTPGQRARGLSEFQRTGLEIVDDFVPEGFNRPFNAVSRELLLINTLGASTLATFGALAVVGFGIVKWSQSVREEAERRLKAENAISAAVNKQILGQIELNKQFEEQRKNAERARNFSISGSQNGISDTLEELKTKRANRERVLSFLPQSNDPKNKVANEFKSDIDALNAEIAQLDAQIFAKKLQTINAPNNAFNQNNENFKKSQEAAIKDRQNYLTQARDLDNQEISQKFALQKALIALNNPNSPVKAARENLEAETQSVQNQIRLLKRFQQDLKSNLSTQDLLSGKGFEIDQKTASDISKLENQLAVSRFNTQTQINAEIEKGKDKIKELGKTYVETFANLNTKLNSNNPFVNLFSEADKSAKTLRETIKLLSPELQKAALALEGKLNSNNLFSARLENKLNVFGLRDEADNFRNPFDASKQKKEQDEFLARFFRNNPNYAFLNNIPANTLIKNLPEAERTKILTRFGNSALTETPADRLNKRLEEQQNLIFGDFRNKLTPDQQSIADKKFISLTSGVNPLELSNSNREAAAIVREREALRQEQNEQKARQQRDALIETNKQIAENGKKLLAIAENEGLQGIEKLLKVEITDNSNGRATITDRAATPQSVEQLYNQDTENGFQFNR